MKIILTSHGSLCKGILESFSMIAGPSDFLVALPLKPDDMGRYKEELRDLINKYQEENILILCDIMGGTPYNESYTEFLKNSKKIRVISGLNLGMLLEVVFAVENRVGLDEIVKIATDAGKKSIKVAEDDTSDKDQDILF